MKMQDSLPQVARAQKDSVSINSNLAYGWEEDVRHTEHSFSGVPSGATMAAQEPSYETIPI